MTGVPPSSLGIPPPLQGDDDDVAWALRTAAVQWNRGARDDALGWLHRAAEAAAAVGHESRSRELSLAATALSGALRELRSAGPDRASARPDEVEVDLSSIMPPDTLQDAVLLDDDVAESLEISAVITGSVASLPPNALRESGDGSAESQAEAPDRVLPDDDDGTDIIDQQAIGKSKPSWTPTPSHRPPFVAYKERVSSLPPSRRAGELRPDAPADETTATVEPSPQGADAAPEVEVSSGVEGGPELEVTASDPAVIEVGPLPPDTAGAGVDAGDEVAGSLPEVEGPDLEYRQSFLPEELDALVRAGATVELLPPESAAGATPNAPLEPAAGDGEEEPVRAEAEAPPPPAAGGRDEADDQAHPASRPSAPSEGETRGPVSVGGVSLGGVPGLEDLPDEAQAAFARRARLETLGTGDEVGAFAVALVVRGAVDIMPMIVDAACARVTEGQVVFTEGSIEEAIPLRAVAAQSPTLVAVWEADALEQATRACPWVDEDLRAVADRFQALAGATMGELGDRLDDSLRRQITDGCELRPLLPHEILVEAGARVGGLFIVGGGRIELVSGTAPAATVEDELGPGDLVFGHLVPSAGQAPQTARAGPRGAILLSLGRHQTLELMMTVPVLIEILSG